MDILAAWSSLESRLISGISHKLTNGLTVLLDVSARDPGDGAAQTRLREETERFDRAIRALTLLSREPRRGREPVIATSFLDDVLSIHGYNAALAEVEVERVVDPETPPMIVDVPLVTRLLLLVLAEAGARVHGREGAKLTVWLGPAGDCASLRIHADASGAARARNLSPEDAPPSIGPEATEAARARLAAEGITLTGPESRGDGALVYEVLFAVPGMYGATQLRAG